MALPTYGHLVATGRDGRVLGVASEASIPSWPPHAIETARVLCEAGTWLKNRDPQAADRFYKALVRRCGRTDIGREADQLRWFPPLAEISPPPAAAGAYR